MCARGGRGKGLPARHVLLYVRMCVRYSYVCTYRQTDQSYYAISGAKKMPPVSQFLDIFQPHNLSSNHGHLPGETMLYCLPAYTIYDIRIVGFYRFKIYGMEMQAGPSLVHSAVALRVHARGRPSCAGAAGGTGGRSSSYFSLRIFEERPKKLYNMSARASIQQLVSQLD